MRKGIAVVAAALWCTTLFAGAAAARQHQFEMAGVQSKAGIRFKCDKARGSFWEDGGGAQQGRYGCTKQCTPRLACAVTCERNGRCRVQLPTDETGAVTNGINAQQFVLGFAIATPR